MAAARWVNDEELLAREFTTSDPMSIEGLSNGPPPADQPLVFLLEYHLGRDEAAVRCCVCERKAEHWNGFVVQAGPGKHLIGSHCGPKHFGLSFRQGGNALKAAVSRQRQLRRALELQARRDILLDYFPPAAAIDSVAAVEGALMGAAPKLYRQLRDLVNRGDPFSVIEEVRDFEREARTNSDGPLYQHVRAPLGPVKGGAVVRARTLERVIDVRRRSLAVLFNALASDTNTMSDRALGALLAAVEADNTKAVEAVADLNSAPDFFAQDNLDRLQAWAATVKVESFEVKAGRIGVPHHYYRDVHWISAPAPPNLPPPPPLFDGGSV